VAARQETLPGRLNIPAQAFQQAVRQLFGQG